MNRPQTKPFSSFITLKENKPIYWCTSTFCFPFMCNQSSTVLFLWFTMSHWQERRKIEQEIVRGWRTRWTEKGISSNVAQTSSWWWKVIVTVMLQSMFLSCNSWKSTKGSLVLMILSLMRKLSVHHYISFRSLKRCGCVHRGIQPQGSNSTLLLHRSLFVVG